MLALRFLSVVAVLVLASCTGGAASSCPCEDPSLCDPVKGSPKKEIFGFVTSQTNWHGYNWTLLTTVALFTDMNYSMLCHAHSQGVRVVLKASYDTAELADTAKVKAWIEDQVKAVKGNYSDGLNIDIEGVVEKGTDQAALLTQLVKDTVAAFKAANSDYQVTFDVAWSPNCIDGRCYDHAAIAAATDFVIIMAYDERSQIYGPCIASANSALSTTGSGIEAYLALGIPAEKLVVGLPWYGYDYPCLSLTEDLICTIPKIPYKGANCSDAAGKEICYSDIRTLIRSSTAFVQWNASLESPYFSYKTPEGTHHQVWFDNTESLTLKYAYSAKRGVRGLAFWEIDCLKYDGSPHDDLIVEEMWGAILVFFDV